MTWSNKTNLEAFEDQRDLIIEFAKAIIQCKDYEFRDEDKRKYYDSLNQCFRPEMKYELCIDEAKRYVQALYKRASSL